MITFIIGGSGSGKSEYAESRLLQVENVEKKFYIATMQAQGLEGKNRVARHQAMRQGKGFLTIEQPAKLCEMEQFEQLNGNAAMLECVSNLLANEMFGGEVSLEDSLHLEKRLEYDIMKVANQCKDFIIVSNNVFEDGIVYDNFTRRYQEVLACLNRALAGMADEVIEVVVGIPVWQKRSN